MPFALHTCMASGVDRVEDLRAWQYAREFKLEVYRLVRSSPTASNDFKYRQQLFDAASAVESDIVEGFRRRKPRVFAEFLTYALASLKEATTRVTDGVHRGYFSSAACVRSLSLGMDCDRSTSNLHAYLERHAKALEDKAKRAKRRR